MFLVAVSVPSGAFVSNLTRLYCCIPSDCSIRLTAVLSDDLISSFESFPNVETPFLGYTHDVELTSHEPDPFDCRVYPFPKRKIQVVMSSVRVRGQGL